MAVLKGVAGRNFYMSLKIAFILALSGISFAKVTPIPEGVSVCMRGPEKNIPNMVRYI